MANTDEIWVLSEARGGKLSSATRQAIAAARALGGPVVGVLAGDDAAPAEELRAFAPVVFLKSPMLGRYEAARHLWAIEQAILSRGLPRAFLAPATSTGSELAPRLAARLRGGFASACVGLRLEGGELRVRRPIYGGKVYEELAIAARPAVLTLRPGAFAPADALPQPAALQALELAVPAGLGLQVVGFEASASSGKPDIAEATRVVAGGRGMGSAEAFLLLEELAAALGGAVGASRSAVDAGWRPVDEQVGKSGRTIAPELYIACGISGAIHHTLGMNTARTVVAVNTDPGALIFQSADFGLVGDALQIVPALTAALRKGQPRR